MLKKILFITLSLSIISFFVWLDYFWGYNRLKNSNLRPISIKKDWKIYKPWSWIKMPVNAILWLEDYQPINDRFIIAIIIIERKDLDINSKDTILYDTIEDKFASISINQLKDIIPSEYDKTNILKWYKAEQDFMIELSKFLENEKTNNYQNRWN